MRSSKLVHTRALALAAAAVTSLACALPASAALVTPVNLSLIAGGGYTQGARLNSTPINVSQSLSHSQPVTPITAPIGAYMLTGEIVELIGDRIHFRTYAGDDRAPAPNNLRTGLLGSSSTGKARYRVDGLDIAGRNIIGFGFSTLDVSGAGTGTFSGIVGGTTFLAMSDTDADGSLDRLELNLEDLRFVARPGVTSFNLNFGDVTVTLISEAQRLTPTVPEPSSIALCFAALAGLGATTRGVARARAQGRPHRQGR